MQMRRPSTVHVGGAKRRNLLARGDGATNLEPGKRLATQVTVERKELHAIVRFVSQHDHRPVVLRVTIVAKCVNHTRERREDGRPRDREEIESDEANELVARFRTSDLGRRAASATRIEREFDFMFEIDDVIVRGQIDLWFEQRGELVMVDYKTDRDESAADVYALQLRLYALALERYAGRRPDRAILYYLRSNRMVEISVTDADLDAARMAVQELKQAQEQLQFPLKVGERCRKCLFWGGVCEGLKEGGGQA